MKNQFRWFLIITAILTIAFSVFFNLYCLRLDSRIAELETKAKLLSNYNLKSKSNIEVVSNEVAKLKENNDFIKDSYSTNVGWASLVLTLLVGGAFAVMALNIIDNSGKVKEIKQEFKEDITALNANYEEQIVKFNTIQEDVLKKNKKTVAAINLEISRTKISHFKINNDILDIKLCDCICKKQEDLIVEYSLKKVINYINICKEQISINENTSVCNKKIKEILLTCFPYVEKLIKNCSSEDNQWSFQIFENVVEKIINNGANILDKNVIDKAEELLMLIETDCSIHKYEKGGSTTSF